jgi:hypothetical protein
MALEMKNSRMIEEALRKMHEIERMLRPMLGETAAAERYPAECATGSASKPITDDPLLAELLSMAEPRRHQLICDNYRRDFRQHIKFVSCQGKILVQFINDKDGLYTKYFHRNFLLSLRDDILPYLEPEKSHNLVFLYHRLSRHFVHPCKLTYFLRVV